MRKISEKKMSEIKEFAKVKKSLMQAQRDDLGYTYCQCCNRPVYWLDVHHIIHLSQIPSHPERNNERNLILLCRSCHRWIHDTTDGQECERKWINNRNLKELYEI